MAAFRMLVVALSPFLRELVTGVLAPEIPVDVVEALASREHLAARIREYAPDIVLLGLGESEVEAVDPLLLKASSLARILALTRNGQSARLYESPGRREILSDLSVASLKEALRASLTRGSD